MAKEKGKDSAANLDSYCTKPDNLVDLFDNSIECHGFCNLFGVNNKMTDGLVEKKKMPLF